ncbi:MAG: helix-turn-helix domain-containing protein [Clostridium sp.]|nr:helix-turn-helix domain-containing protein [Clostridium sp.]
MNVLLVDDQKAIVDSLKNGIHWDNLPVGQVYTACSAREAKLVLTNFAVDVLVTDIEMPEEDGLSLCNWAKNNFPSLECIFLTSHAEFDYAKEAIKMGGFDYILQPVRYEEVEKVLLKVWDKIRSNRRILQIMDSQKAVMEQSNHILEAMLSKAAQEKVEDANQIYRNFHEIFCSEYDNCSIYLALIQVVRWKKITNIWNEKLVSLVFCNVLDELFLEHRGKTGIACQPEDRYWIFLVVENQKNNDELMHNYMKTFYTFIDENMDFSIAFYPADLRHASESKDFYSIYRQLNNRFLHNTERKKGIIIQDVEFAEEKADDNSIDLAIRFVKKNLNKNISRTEVAEHVHLNEEYFSRLFRQQTGATFKDFVLSEKMNEAKNLLAHSRLSIGIIASKIGYDNFSHFSKMFKKMTNLTPQEYRKEYQE